MVNTHLVLAVQLSLYYHFVTIFDILILKKQTWKIKSCHSHDSMALMTYLLTDMLASNGSPIGPTSSKTCVINGMVSNTKPVRY